MADQQPTPGTPANPTTPAADPALSTSIAPPPPPAANPPAQQPPAPFTLTHSLNFPELLHQLGCTLALSTYQAGKVVFVSASSVDDLVQLPRNFVGAMGVALEDTAPGDGSPRMAVACSTEVVCLANSPSLARTYPKQPNVYDGLFMPRTRHQTGPLDLHDLCYGEGGLWAVNTRFSCLVRLSDRFGFEPVWKPDFITALEPEDRCHLNGLTLKDGKPEYVTAIDTTDTAGGWRPRRSEGHGVLIHVPTGKKVLEGLYMPHSPRLYRDGLFLLSSGTGELLKADLATGKVQSIAQLNGFARGMSRIGDIVFIGVSKLRKKNTTFQELPVSKRSMFAGVAAVDLRGPSVIGWVKYETSVDEIYDVQVIPGLRRPGIVSAEMPESSQSIYRPGASYWANVAKA